MSKPSGSRGIYLDWDASVRDDITGSEWESGVLDTIQDLLLPPCQSSTAVLDAIGRAGKGVTISPERKPLMPGKSDANAHADPIDPVAATIAGGTPDPPQGDLRGTGKGSDVILKFTAQDWEPSSATASLKAVDERCCTSWCTHFDRPRAWRIRFRWMLLSRFCAEAAVRSPN
jgi:hypothetical protein